MNFKTVFELLKDSFNDWMEDYALRLSAALAYYSVFSLAPLLIIVMGIAGIFLGQEAVQGQLDNQLQSLLGSKEAAEAIQGMVKGASKQSSGVLATIVGFVTLLFGASGVFGQLKDALNTVWEVKAKPGGGIMGFIKERILSIGMIVVIGFLLLVSLVLTAILGAMTKGLGTSLLAGFFTFIVSFAVVTLLFATIFKVLPDVEIEWRDVWVGAAFTAFLFEVGKQLLSLYFSKGAVASSYGVAGSLVVLLLWVYYSSLIVLFGAEFIQVYCKKFGRKMLPSKNAIAVTAEERAHQGMPAGEKAAPIENDAGSTAQDDADALAEREEELAWARSRAAGSQGQGYVRDAVLTAVGVGFGMGLLSLLLPSRRPRRNPEPTLMERARHPAAAFLIPLAVAASRFFGKMKRETVNLVPASPKKKARAFGNQVMNFLVHLAD